jgi:flagellar P-ring protein precursor FlgI
MSTTGRRWIVGWVALALALAGAVRAPAMSIQDMTMLDGTGENRLWGLGIVVGLAGTGDATDALPLARQLVSVLEAGGVSVPNLEEVFGGQNAAMVMVTCELPAEGARAGERYDVAVESWFGADSLAGGRLFITPLQGPLPGQGVYAFADGPVTIEGTTETAGRVRGGAQVAQDLTAPVVDAAGRINLIVKPEYTGWTTTKLLANTINQDRQGLREDAAPIARAIDAKSVEVTIPAPERAHPANFIGNVLSIRLDPSLLELPARVIVNERTGSIVVTGEVQISPAVISHRGLVVTTVEPEPPPTPDQPRVGRSNVTAVETIGDERRMARLGDLLEAMKALDVPVNDRIAILAQLHKAGKLHAEFIRE